MTQSVVLVPPAGTARHVITSLTSSALSQLVNGTPLLLDGVLPLATREVPVTLIASSNPPAGERRNRRVDMLLAAPTLYRLAGPILIAKRRNGSLVGLGRRELAALIDDQTPVHARDLIAPDVTSGAY